PIWRAILHVAPTTTTRNRCFPPFEKEVHNESVFAITRKNSLFAGSDGGGRTWATIATLLTTAKMNQVDPHAWLTQTLERIANGWPNSAIEALMPWNYHR
ncbi:transposase domain-containing protein, partial [Mesorhizobium sp. M1328]|uniref:transposase domain-containing protein n=1 Tax=Mesorhizobium sp. M1328 TaxID=2957082 RepID=UPI00333AC893